MTGRPGELGIGDRVRSGGRDRVVIGVSGPVVRLAGTGGEVVAVSVSGLLADGDFAVLDSRPRPGMPQVSVLDGLPAEAVEEARWWERHIVEVLTGVPPDTGEGTIPRPEYDPAVVTLTRREQAKAAELTAAGHPVTASAVAKRRRRYEIYKQQPALRGEHVARVRLAVQQLLGGAAAADHSSQASQRAAEQFPVRVGERRSAVAARHELLSLLDSIREARRRDIQLAHARMQPLKRTGVVGW